MSLSLNSSNLVRCNAWSTKSPMTELKNLIFMGVRKSETMLGITLKDVKFND